MSRLKRSATLLACVLCFLALAPAKQRLRPSATLPTVDFHELGSRGLYVCPMRLCRVIDGDTYDVEMYIWKNLRMQTRVRLLGVNTPELHPRKGTEQEKVAERAQAIRARLFAEATMKNARLYFVTTGDRGSFGRLLGVVYVVDESQPPEKSVINLNQALLDAGLAKPYKKKQKSTKRSKQRK